MRGELVSVTTADFVKLHGFFCSASASDQTQVDGVVLVHGLAGNFYSSPLMTALANQIRNHDISYVMINSRGHDFLNFTMRGGRSRTNGAAIEDVSECPMDINAWVEFLAKQGCRKIAILGHSLGAIKAIFSQAYTPHPLVSKIVALSPTRLNYQQFSRCRDQEKFLTTMALAKERVAQNRGDELIQIEFPFPTWMVASSYLKKYGPEDHYDWFRFVEQIEVPLLITFGQLELDLHPAFEGLSESLDELEKRWIKAGDPDQIGSRRKIAKIPKADHFYTTCFEPLGQLVIDWLQFS